MTPIEVLQRAVESVRAFERIARELAAHGAPAVLVEGTRLAAAHERDHAARCAELLGVDAVIARRELPIRSAFELALDTAREPFGTLDHVALSRALAAWLDARLLPAERVAVRAARLDALEHVRDVPARRCSRLVT
jgi:hypothetical protein